MSPSVVPQTGVCQEKQRHWRGGGHEVFVLPRQERKQRPRPYPVKAAGTTLRHKTGQTDYDKGRMSRGGVFALTVSDQDCGPHCNLAEW